MRGSLPSADQGPEVTVYRWPLSFRSATKRGLFEMNLCRGPHVLHLALERSPQDFGVRYARETKSRVATEFLPDKPSAPQRHLPRSDLVLETSSVV